MKFNENDTSRPDCATQLTDNVVDACKVKIANQPDEQMR